MRIERLTEERMAGYHAALDSVARERRWIGFVEAPPLETLGAWARKTFIERGFPCLLPVEDDTVVGWADIVPIDRPVLAHVGAVGMGLVAPWRGRGFGGALLAALLEAGREKGLERLELQVFSENRAARRLYERHGFAVEGVRRRAAKIDGRYDDIVCMARLFDAAG